MNSSVIKLQESALDSNVKVSDLLRTAWIISKKLKLVEFEKWAKCELNGYKNKIDFPDYRIVSGDLKIKGNNRINEDIVFKDSESLNYFSKKPIPISVIEIESLLKGDGQIITGRLSLENEKKIYQSSNLNYSDSCSIVVYINRSKFEGILESIRMYILNWCILLEEQGILGDNLIFTSEDGKKAKEAMIVNNFSINFADKASDIQILQNSIQME